MVSIIRFNVIQIIVSFAQFLSRNYVDQSNHIVLIGQWLNPSGKVLRKEKKYYEIKMENLTSYATYAW